MMRGQRNIAVAVRHPSGRIVTHAEVLKGTVYDSRWTKIPLLRGLIMLWEMMVLGTRTLMFSAEVALETEQSDGEAKMPTGVLWGTVIFALVAGVGVFFVLPVVLTSMLDRWVTSAFLSNLVEKLFRLGLLVGYIALVGRIPDIRRVFAYHGAEHKTINAYEDDAPLEVSHVQRYGTSHPRCGTSFLLIVVVVSFLVYLMLGKPPMLERILSRVVLIPIIAGIAYEFIRLGANNYHRAWVRTLLSPGLALQRLTTREPDDSQVETAIAALQHVLSLDQGRLSDDQAVAVEPLASRSTPNSVASGVPEYDLSTRD